MRRASSLIVAIAIAVASPQPGAEALPTQFQRAGQLKARVEASRLDEGAKALVRKEYGALDAELHAVWSPLRTLLARAALARSDGEARVAELQRRVREHEERAARLHPSDRLAVEASHAEAEGLAAEAERLKTKMAREAASLDAELRAATAAMDTWLAGPRLATFNRTAEALAAGRVRWRPGMTWSQLAAAATTATKGTPAPGPRAPRPAPPPPRR